MINKKIHKTYDVEPVKELLISKGLTPDYFIDKFISSIDFLEKNKIGTTSFINQFLKRAKRKDIEHIFHDFSIAKFLHLYLTVFPTSKIEINKTNIGPDTVIDGLKCEIKSKLGLYYNILQNGIIENEYIVKGKFGELFEKEYTNISGITIDGKIIKPKSPLITGIKQNSDVVVIDISSTDLGLIMGGRDFKSVLPKIAEKQLLYIFLQDVKYSNHYYSICQKLEDVLWNKLKLLSQNV